ncbi:MAG: hypothetical protein ACRD5K_09690, partial [Candidatus Acidiferrales bacterium]
ADQAIEIIEKRLDSGWAEKGRNTGDVGRGAGGVLRKRIGDAGFVSQIVGAIGAEMRIDFRARESREKMLQRLGKKDALGALGDGGIRVEGQDGEQFEAFIRSERDAAGADGQLLLRAGMAGANLCAELATNEDLQMAQPDRCA